MTPVKAETEKPEERLASTIDEKIAELEAKREELKLGGGEDRIERQHATGKLSARERVARLVDKESFEEIGLFARHRATYFGMAGKELPADGVVTGCATIDGRLVHLASQDFTVAGGAAGETHSNKVAEMMAMSLKTGSPFIFINDSGGARVQEGIDSLAGYARVFYNNVMLSGTVPQVSLICGPCAGGAAYSPALTDFIIQTEQARMFITGPQVIKQVTGEEVSAEDLGGPRSQMHYSGVVHLIARNDDHAIQLCKRLLSYLPANNLEDPPRMTFNAKLKDDDSMNKIVPADPKQAYDVRQVIARVVDHDDFLESAAMASAGTHPVASRRDVLPIRRKREYGGEAGTKVRRRARWRRSAQPFRENASLGPYTPRNRGRRECDSSRSGASAISNAYRS